MKYNWNLTIKTLIECDVMIAMIEKQRKQMYNEMDGFIAKKQKRKQENG